MKKIKACYRDELSRVTEKICEERGDFLFSLVADTHLDNSLSDTLDNISAVDETVGFDCLVHLGDFLNGNIPKNYTKQILKEQMDAFAGATENGVFYPAQGNHDGYIDFLSANDIALDEDWAEATAFVGSYANVVRPKGKPYFYADYPEKNIRLIIVCSFHYTGFYEGEGFSKQYGIDAEQIKWLEDEALNVGEDYTVMLFSHDTPFSNFDEEHIFDDNRRVNGNLAFKTLLKCKKERGFDVAAWFVGHFHGELTAKYFDINFILIGCETAYVPQLWDMPANGFYYERELGTKTEDLWDSVILNKSERTLSLIRFGAGEDRRVEY